MRVLFGIQVSQLNSETNWRRYSGEQFESSLAMKWIWTWRLLPAYMTFHCLQTDTTDKQRQMFNAMHDSSHCLYRLLLDNSVEPSIHTLCKHKNYRIPFARTSRFKNSFLPRSRGS